MRGSGRPTYQLRFAWIIAALAIAALLFAESSRTVPSVGNSQENEIAHIFAHFASYAALAYCLLSWFKPHTSRGMALIVLVTALYGISDEIHQVFVPGRDASVSDALVDLLGATISAIAVATFRRSTRERVDIASGPDAESVGLGVGSRIPSQSPKAYSLRSSITKGGLLLGALIFVVLLSAVETLRVVRFTHDVLTARSELLALKNDLDIGRLRDTEKETVDKQERLRTAQKHLGSARGFVRSDLILALSTHTPIVGKQAMGLKAMVEASDDSVSTALRASGVALAFARYQRSPNGTALEDAIAFLRSQEEPMAEVEAGVKRLQERRGAVPDGLIGPLGRGKAQLSDAIDKLQGLVQGYDRADHILPELLGFNGPRHYLVLPQNDTELFPSGGLISSYGIATFDSGKLVKMDLEYFGTLFDRWQTQTHEYIKPPTPLHDYLLDNISWGLGEAGWFPDFPTTAKLARDFVDRGGAPPTEGTIAIDLQFMSALLQILGPVSVPDYGATVTSENLSELTLQFTRDEAYVPGEPHQAFLSHLSRAVLGQLFSVPKERWVDLLRLLDRMGRERHLQMNFSDSTLQTLSTEYGFDGSIVQTDHDFLLIADTSVNSTKLNLILKPSVRVDLELMPNGTARSQVIYKLQNPFTDWQAGRDPRLVRALMLGGVYGSYLRVYAPERARMREVRLDGQQAGAGQVDTELGKRVIGRFFSVPPGATREVRVLYETTGVAKADSNGLFHYQLYLQKESGTTAIPLVFSAKLPDGAVLREIRLGGEKVSGPEVFTDLRTDREIEIVYSIR